MIRTRRFTLATLAAASLLVAACGGSSSTKSTSSGPANGAAATTSAVPPASASSSSSSSTPTAPGPDNGVAAKSPLAIVTAARSALLGTRAVRVSGNVTNAGQQVGLDLHLVNGQGGQGQVTTQGLQLQLIVLGGVVYIKGDRAFLQHFGGAAAVQLFQGKWLKAPATGGMSSFARLTSIRGLFGSTLSNHQAFTKGAKTTVDGLPAVTISDAKGDALYVATSGPPYPLAIEKRSGAELGRLDFRQYDEPVTLAAPAGAVDLSALAGK